MEQDELSYQVIGCAMKVHNILGHGFLEWIYQGSLSIELEIAGMVFRREVEKPIYYNNIKVGTRKADFVVDEKITVSPFCTFRSLSSSVAIRTSPD